MEGVGNKRSAETSSWSGGFAVTQGVVINRDGIAFVEIMLCML